MGFDVKLREIECVFEERKKFVDQINEALATCDLKTSDASSFVCRTYVYGLRKGISDDLQMDLIDIINDLSAEEALSAMVRFNSQKKFGISSAILKFHREFVKHNIPTDYKNVDIESKQEPLRQKFFQPNLSTPADDPGFSHPIDAEGVQ